MRNIYILIIAISLLIVALTLHSADYIDDAYIPPPGAYKGLTEQDILDLEAEREFSRELDKQVSRGKARTITVEATAYTHTGNKTATGTWPEVGRTIAVDPNVIPLGSQVLIDGQVYIAEDTGGAIKGNIIDIFMDTENECWEWGRQEIEVIVLD